MNGAQGARAGVVGHAGRRGGRRERPDLLEVDRPLPGGGPAGTGRSSLDTASQSLADAEERVQSIVALRRLRMTAAEIASCLGMALSTVSAVLRRVNLGKRSRLDPLEPPNRYERARPGSCCTSTSRSSAASRGGGHRSTGHRRADPSECAAQRGAGWEYVHVCVDDATRLAYVEVLADEKAVTVARVPAPRGRLLPPPRHHRRARHDRQRPRPTAQSCTPSPAAP